ncbi:MAG: general secretion pathway protein E [Candidatus Endobugula sp.]|jgi:general secretion pathway protein E
MLNSQNSSDFTYATLFNALIEKKALAAKDIPSAKRLLQEDPNNLIRTLVSLGWISEQQLAEIIAQHTGYIIIQDTDYPTLPEQGLPISLRFIQEQQIIPYYTANNELVVVMNDPLNQETIDALHFLFEHPPIIKTGIASLITQAITLVYSPNSEGDDNSDIDTINEPTEDDIEHLKDLASEAPVIQFVNKTIQQAAEQKASDIHFEPKEQSLTIRYRVDGILNAEKAPANCPSAAILSRIKIMAKLDIAERRLPQDGRIMTRSQGKTLDIRVSTLPTIHGESIVMRILNREDLDLNFDTLGFSSDTLNSFMSTLSIPHGIILVTGPTGSGKSTTLYTALAHLNTPKVKIITVEDPVEYQLDGINQVPVKAQIGLDFAHSLRSIVRQDPDIIMIGEMRDVETAKIAIQSALTGHMVLSTLHTNSASGGITRLQDMGIDNYLLTSTINGILGQRLIRQLCHECREAYQPNKEEQNMIKSAGPSAAHTRLYRPKGCQACSHSGYRGRTMLVEWLPMSESIAALVMSNASASKLQHQAIQDGMTNLFQDGIRKVIQGDTSIEEVLRVTQQDNS